MNAQLTPHTLTELATEATRLTGVARLAMLLNAALIREAHPLLPAA